MELHPVASTLLVIWFLIGSIVTTAALVGLVLALRALNARIEQALEKIQPILDKADGLLVTAGDKLETISDKTESILTQGRDIADDVHTKVDRTAIAVQRTVNAPIVHSNSLLTGIRQGVSTFLHLQRGQTTVRTQGGNDLQNRVREQVASDRPATPTDQPTTTTNSSRTYTTVSETPLPALAVVGGGTARKD